MKNILKEFREFAVKGNVIDLAVGLIVGAAFNKIVTSLVNDIIMPPIGLLLGKVDFANLFFAFGGGEYSTVAQAKAAGVTVVSYGAFINTIIEFVIVAFAVFFMIRLINRLRREPEPSTKKCEFCKSEIALDAKRCPHCTSELSN